MSSGFVAIYYDAEAVVPGSWTVDSLAAGEATRLLQLRQVAEIARDMKRRLGPDVEQADLALDKRRCRQVGHLAVQLQAGWLSELVGSKVAITAVKPGSSPEWAGLVRLASTVDWDRYAAETIDELRDRCRLVVTWALNNNERKFANRAANRYTVEMERMARIMGRT